MAFISTEEVKSKRLALKAAFPAKEGWKFSVTRRHYTEINIAIMQYPDSYDFGTGHTNVNHFWIQDSDFGENEKEVLTKINEIAHIGHFDESDAMTDYFHCAFYITIQVGKWDKIPAVVPAKVKLPTTADKLNTFYFKQIQAGANTADVLQMMYS